MTQESAQVPLVHGKLFVCQKCGKKLDAVISPESDVSDWVCPVCRRNGKENGKSESTVNHHKENVTMNATDTKNSSRGTRAMKGNTTKKKATAKPKDKPKVADERKIELLVEENPKRGESAKRFELYKKAKTVQDYLDKGGQRGDIAWDIAHKFIKVTKS